MTRFPPAPLPVLALAVVAFASIASATAQNRRTGGGAEGHGGAAVVCRAEGAAGTILSAELLDLYEARAVHGRSVSRTAMDETVALEKALTRIARFEKFRARVEVALAAVRTNLRYVPSGTALAVTDDYFPIVRQRGCAIEQLAIYRPDGTVLVDGDIHAALGAADRAALALHEAIYRVDRDERGASDSRVAREMTGLLFADAEDGPAISALHALYVRTPFLEGRYRSRTFCSIELVANADEESFRLVAASVVDGDPEICAVLEPCLDGALRYLPAGSHPGGDDLWWAIRPETRGERCMVEFPARFRTLQGYGMFIFSEGRTGRSHLFGRNRLPPPQRWD